MNYNRINYNFKFSVWCKSHLPNFKLFEKLQQIKGKYLSSTFINNVILRFAFICISTLEECQAGFIDNRNNVDFLTSIGNF